MKKHILVSRLFLVLLLALLGATSVIMVQPAHAAKSLPTKSLAVKPASCANTTEFQGTNTDRTGVYTVYLEVHYVWSFGCFPYLYTAAQAYVAEGNSYNIKVCTGEVPEAAHAAEICNTYSGYAGLHGWASPFFDSYKWDTYGCGGYADIEGHVNIQSGTGCP